MGKVIKKTIANKKNSKLLIPAVLIGLAAVIMICLPKETEITGLERPDYGEEESLYDIRAKIGEDAYDLEIAVPAREISADELQRCFDKAYETILEKMSGNNDSLDCVRQNLVFTEEIHQYGMTAEYSLDNYDIVNCFGEVNGKNADSEGSRLKVYIDIQYKEFSQTYETEVTVFPPVYSREDEIENAVVNQLSDDKEKSSKYIELPQTIDGETVTYSQSGQNYVAVVILLIVAVLSVLYYKKIVVPKKLAVYREKQMSLDYSDIVSKLSLLMGAGMSGAAAFAKIAVDYTETKQKSRIQKRYAYEEIVAASNRIATGVPEDDAYAAFGRACKIHCYVKLGNLMSQNVRKGGEGFTRMLREEVDEAFMERKSLARKGGEEAGTKLLLPMIIMLGIVLIIIIIPAFMSF